MTPKQVLVQAFRALTPKQKSNLLWHAEQGTHICCGGSEWSWFADGKGGG